MMLLLACAAREAGEVGAPVPLSPDAPAESGAFRWQPLVVAGAPVAGVRFGPETPPGRDGLDGQGLYRVDGVAWLLSHFERAPSALQRSRVDVEGGRLLSTEAVDLGGIEGLNFCAAAQTPWGSHLGSMEYEPDAAIVGPDGRLPVVADRGGGLGKVEDEGYNRLSPGSPYRVGWAWEARPEAGGIHLRKALGRFSHESARVMADARTVYLSDDHGEGGGLYLFVADEAGNLAAGELYAARWGERLEWVSLGHAGEEELEPMPAFSELFDRVLAERCPEGFGRAVQAGASECLRLRPGQERLASRLETRRLAALRGASTWITKEEGLASDGSSRLWIAVSVLSAPDGRRLNPCGGVYLAALGPGTDVEGRAIDSPYVAGPLELLLEGAPRGESCGAEGIANPDNLLWIGDRLLIAEDSHRREDRRSWLWSWREGELRPLFASPVEAELTGLEWSAELGRVTLAVQGNGRAPGFVGLLRPP